MLPFGGGGTWSARGLRANERMYYELMTHARRRGCTRFDFGRSKTGSGPYAIKKNWGFTPAPLTYHEWSPPGTAPPHAARGQTSARRVCSHTPLCACALAFVSSLLVHTHTLCPVPGFFFVIFV